MNPFRPILNFFGFGVTKEDDPSEDEKLRQRNWEIRNNTLGVFHYSNDGFELALKKEFHSIKWTDIERIVAYKADLITTDEVCMEITFGSKTVTITEETWGWYQFVERLKNSLPINDQWESQVLQSPFEYDETIVYERSDRRMPAQSNFFSTIKGCTEEQVRYLFQTKGWAIRRPSLKAFELKNTWAELVLDTKTDSNDLLIHGLVAYHPDNIKALEDVFRKLNCNYQFEFYDEGGQLIYQKK